MTVEYKCTDVYKKPENPTEWLPCPRCGLRPLVWEFDNGRFTACGCGTDCYSHWSVRAESIMSVIKRSDNGKSAEVYDIEKEMKRIADNIFGYNPKIDPRDPLFRKTLSWSVKKEGKGKKNEKND